MIYALAVLISALPVCSWAITPLPSTNQKAIDANFLDMAKEIKRIDLTDGGTIFQRLTVSSSAVFGAGIYSSSNIVVLGGLTVYGDTAFASSISFVATDASLLGTGSAVDPLQVNSASVCVLQGGYIRAEEIEAGDIDTTKLAAASVTYPKLSTELYADLVGLHTSTQALAVAVSTAVTQMDSIRSSTQTLGVAISTVSSAIADLYTVKRSTGVALVVGDIADGAIETAKLATDSVIAIKILNGAVQTAKLGAQSVTSEKLDDELEISSASITGSRFAVSGASFTVREGRVGIGRAAFPSVYLQMQNDGGEYGGTSAKFNTNIQDNAGNQGVTLGYNSRTDGVVGAAAVASGLMFITHTGSAWKESMRIADDGKVGISTMTPQATLEVRGNAAFGSTTQSTFSTTGALTINPLAVTGLTYGTTIYSTGGRVGIGTSAPLAKLHVANPNIGANQYVVFFSTNGTDPLLGIHTNGHIAIYGDLPTLGVCANGALVENSSDGLGQIDFSGINASCEITFVREWDSTPICFCTTKSAGGNGCEIESESTTAVKLKPMIGQWASGDSLHYNCKGLHD